ncbi:hypothetical protein A3762_05710 [Oleiphilus sp. HI0125]|uniref:hypothetical protein n=1 Tax=Oleiphilus sp. HI0125 TaxID=1822266 RepID=UPI0007C2C81F|nr:hypothetical protein [Oleiphilus sp. HI0125]KZZ59221.1 hypothetical protein A3762_05710 [Oleiphilus sp. HI0125]
MSLYSVIVGLVVVCISSFSHAASYKVTNSKSSGNGSIRWAIEQANNNPGADIVEVPGSFDSSNPIVPGTGGGSSRYTFENPILVTDDITIKGLGSSRHVIDDHQH